MPIKLAQNQWKRQKKGFLKTNNFHLDKQPKIIGENRINLITII